MAVNCAVVFGTSLDGLISHPVMYGQTWDVLIQAEGGYGSFAPGSISRLLAGQPSVAGWSEFAFTQLRVGGKVTRRQVRAIITWQTTLTLLIALGAGMPLGSAAGRWAWRSFAASLGVVPVTVIPVLALAAGSAALIAAGNLLALAPATIAARTPTDATLRAE